MLIPSNFLTDRQHSPSPSHITSTAGFCLKFDSVLFISNLILLHAYNTIYPNITLVLCECGLQRSLRHLFLIKGSVMNGSLLLPKRRNVCVFVCCSLFQTLRFGFLMTNPNQTLNEQKTFQPKTTTYRTLHLGTVLLF